MKYTPSFVASVLLAATVVLGCVQQAGCAALSRPAASQPWQRQYYPGANVWSTPTFTPTAPLHPGRRPYEGKAEVVVFEIC